MSELARRIDALHAAGLDSRYDDVILFASADATDAAAMREGCHFDYIAQTFVDGHDHAHYCTGAANASLPLLFCGADTVSCLGISASTGADVL